ncbi:MAG: hypothetical protein JW934_12360 [Anaerolineae bacterium]|nr:hypothetical protein [Anaerolineae bacterium]
MEYNLTDTQRELLRWLVSQVRTGKLSEEFWVVWMFDGGEIGEWQGEHPKITRGMLDALAEAELVQCVPHYKTISRTVGKANPRLHTSQSETNRSCIITRRAFDAVDNNFVMPDVSPETQVNIGSIIHNMSGGNVQAVGFAQETEFSQLVNDPELLCSQIDNWIEELVDKVKPDLAAADLVTYIQTAQELKDQIVQDKPNPSMIKRALATLGFLGDIEGSVGLIIRIWPFITTILPVIVARLGGYSAFAQNLI